MRWRELLAGDVLLQREGEAAWLTLEASGDRVVWFCLRTGKVEASPTLPPGEVDEARWEVLRRA